VCLLVTAAAFAKTQSLHVTIGTRPMFQLEGGRKAYVILPMVLIGVPVALFPDKVTFTIRQRRYVCP